MVVVVTMMTIMMMKLQVNRSVWYVSLQKYSDKSNTAYLAL